MDEFKIDQQKIDAAMKEALDSQKVPNVLLMGQVKVGKTSAFNYIFKEQRGKTSAHEPCTIDITLYKGENVNIYDSEGYEYGHERLQHYEKLIFDDFLSKEKYKDFSNKEAVHLVWYAVSAKGKFTDLDKTLITRLQKEGYKVALLLTKIDEQTEKGLNEYLNVLKEDVPNVEVFKLSIYSNEKLNSLCNWDKLIDWSYNNLPAILQNRYLAELKENNKRALELKHSIANDIITAAATAAADDVRRAYERPSPLLPIIGGLYKLFIVSDIVPIQTRMIVKILTIYGIKITDATGESLVKQIRAKTLGQTIAGGLIQLIPGVGTVIGREIDATIAARITTALGRALESICKKQAEAIIEGKWLEIDIEELLSSEEFIKQVMETYQNINKG